jgi:hypothetical protein
LAIAEQQVGFGDVFRLRNGYVIRQHPRGRLVIGQLAITKAQTIVRLDGVGLSGLTGQHFKIGQRVLRLVLFQVNQYDFKSGAGAGDWWSIVR